MKAKILIVGGGAMGTCIALHAAQRCDPLREPVVLIEKDRLGAGSSGRTAAIVHQGYSERVMASMARDAVKVYAGLKSATGRSVGYRKTGVLILADMSNPESVAQLERDIEMQSSLAIDVKRVGVDEIRSLVPGIEVEGEALGAWQPAGGFVNPGRAIEVFAGLARDKGAITRIGVKDPRVLVENGRAVGVQTSEGTFHAPNVVLATGPWTPGILSELGIELPLILARLQETFLRMPAPEIAEEDDLDLTETSHSDLETRFVLDPLDSMPVAHPVVIDLGQDFYARCEPAHCRTRFGQNNLDGLKEYKSREDLPESVAPDFAVRMRRAVTERLPHYRDLDDLGSQVSWITLTPDRRPIAGPVEALPGLFVVTGFSGNDFQLAPSIGEGLAQMIVGQPVSAFDPEFFSLGRF